jgi:prepilin-type N-terminal cleavage/methylation domain-containing protein
MHLLYLQKRGFTLTELLVAMALIGVLATIVYANFGSAGATGRDAQRQADLRLLQTAIEQYKVKNGYYPAGCQGENQWSGGTYGCPTGNEYIVGLVAGGFISRLPVDPRPGTAGTQRGYVYVSNRHSGNNTGGTVYKLMALNTVESETVTYSHPLKSCDIRPDAAGRFQNVNENGIDTGGWCAWVHASNGPVSWCRGSDIIGNQNTGEFLRSYGVWGGFAAERTSGSRATRVQDTTAIICKGP